MTSRSARRSLALTFALAGATAFPALAQAQSDTPRRNFVVGGVAAIPEFEGSADSRVVPLVIANVDLFGARVEVEGIQGITVDLLSDPFWRAGPALGAQLPRDDSADDPRVALLPEVNFAVELGGFVGFETPFGGLREGRLSGDVTVRHDIAGAHEGLTVKGDLDYFFAVSRQLRFLVGANATFAGDSFFDAYYSVDPITAQNAGLTAFDADAGLKDIGAEASMIFSFSPTYALFVRGAYNRLLGDAADSPIVEDIGSADQVFIGGGVFFSF